MDEKTVVQAELRLGIEGFKQELDSSIAMAQAAVEKMNGMGGNPVSTAPLAAGIPAPPLPPPVAPTPPSAPGGAGGASPVSAAWEELEKIKAIAKTAPDIAMAAIQGNGGLQARALKGGVANPEAAGEYQEIVSALKELTSTLKSSDKDGNPVANILKMMRGNAVVGALGTVGSNVMSGNVLGAGGSMMGAALGAIGGPLGMQAGAQVGQMLGNGVGAFLDKTGEAREYAKTTAGIAARFGDFSQEAGLKPGAMADMKTYGYDNQQTAGMFDALRQNRVISGTGEDSKELVSSLQALTRATGQSTEAMIQNYSAYKTQGGSGDANQYMAQMIGGAVSVGMKENLQQYQELVGSARSQLVYGSAQADTGDGALKKIQGTLTTLMSGQGDTAKLMRDNPALAQQMLGGFVATGGAQAYSRDAAMMQLAGIDRSKTDKAFLTADQTVENATIRAVDMLNKSMPGIQSVLGMSEEQIKEASKQDPNFLKNKFSSDNPNTEQAGALQDVFRMQYQAQYGAAPDAMAVQRTLQIGNNALANNGQVNLNAPTNDGKSTLKKDLEDAMQTEGQKALAAEAEKKQEMMKFFGQFAGLLTSIDEAVANIMRGVNVISSFLGGSQAAAPTTGLNNDPNMALGAKTALGLGAASEKSGELFGGVISADKKTLLGGDNGSIDFKKAASNANFSFGAEGIPGVAGMTGGFTPNLSLPGTTGAIGAPHFKFNDTPNGGVRASHGFNTFEFAPGDIVQASPAGGGGGSGGGNSMVLNFSMNFSVGEGSDRSLIGSAAKQGVKAGVDEFMQAWEAGPLEPKNSPRISGRMY